MKYLFFDLECSNCFGGIGKICEFGYVIVDEQFNIIRSDAIPMSPGRGREARFDKGVYKRDPTFQWAYDFETYFDCPEFTHYYANIKKLLESDDITVIGYAVDNDIRYIQNTCDRYNLVCPVYEAYDAQIIMKKYLPDQHRRLGLKGAFGVVCGLDELVKMQAHLSRDDAIMTMRIVQEICKKLEFTLDELLEVCSNSKLDSKKVSESIRLKAEKAKRKKSRIIWNKMVESNYAEAKDENSRGRLVIVSNATMKHFEEFKKVCDKIKERKLVPINKIRGSDYLICFDNNDIGDFNKRFEDPYSGKMISVSEFLKNF